MLATKDKAGTIRFTADETGTIRFTVPQTTPQTTAHKKSVVSVETANKIASIINALLKDADLVHFTVIGDRWPDCKCGKFDSARVVDYGDGTASVALSACHWHMTGAGKWRINPYDRLLSCKTTNGYGEPILFSWRDVRDPNGTWEMWRDAADAMPYH